MSGQTLQTDNYKLKTNVGFSNKEIKNNKNNKATEDFDSFIAKMCLEYYFYYLIHDFLVSYKIYNFSCNDCSRLLLREKFKLGAWFIFKKKRPVCTLFDHMSVINLNQKVINRSLLKFWHQKIIKTKKLNLLFFRLMINKKLEDFLANIKH